MELQDLIAAIERYLGRVGKKDLLWPKGKTIHRLQHAPHGASWGHPPVKRKGFLLIKEATHMKSTAAVGASGENQIEVIQVLGHQGPPVGSGKLLHDPAQKSPKQQTISPDAKPPLFPSEPGLDVPVLLIAFRRPDLTALVLEAIRGARPQRLFVAVDGPRAHFTTEAEQVAATRTLISSNIDWPCHLEQLHQPHNLGCRRGVETALNWFFSQVNEGIVLEDDIVPLPSFFPYCRELLEIYRDDPAIGAIAGASVDPRPSAPGPSYRFSQFLPIWGWASWHRAWQLHDPALPQWPQLRNSRLLEQLGGPRFARVMGNRIDEVVGKRCDTWDYGWFLSCWQAGLLGCVPAVNLVQNIGFRDPMAVHTKLDYSFLPSPRELNLPLVHPRDRRLDRRLDQRLLDRLYAPSLQLRTWRRLVRLWPGEKS